MSRQPGQFILHTWMAGFHDDACGSTAGHPPEQGESRDENDQLDTNKGYNTSIDRQRVCIRPCGLAFSAAWK